MKSLKNITKFIHNRVKRTGELIQFINSKENDDIKFYIVSPLYNSNFDTIKCLDSVYKQNFSKERVKHIVIDDVSTDNTAELIDEWMMMNPDNTVNFVKNKVNQGLCANNHYSFLDAPKNSIILMLDGDDWLADNNVLSYLARIYSNNDIWATYNTWISSTGNIVGSTRKLSKKTIENNTFRKSPWVTSHLKTFRAELYKHIPVGYLTDPKTNTWWEKSSDRAFFVAILELAGSHIYHCYKLCYIYNIREHTKNNKHINTQEDCSKRISLLSPLPPLSKLNSDLQ